MVDPITCATGLGTVKIAAPVVVATVVGTGVVGVKSTLRAVEGAADSLRQYDKSPIVNHLKHTVHSIQRQSSPAAGLVVGTLGFAAYMGMGCMAAAGGAVDGGVKGLSEGLQGLWNGINWGG